MPIDQAAQLRGDGARGDRHRQRRRGAGKRSADQNAGADHHGDKPVRGGKRHKTDDIHERAGNHDRAKAEARRQCAGDGLQEAPSKVLDGDRQREIGHRNVDVLRQRLHEQAEALTQTHAEAEHDRRADEDRQRRSEPRKFARRAAINRLRLGGAMMCRRLLMRRDILSTAAPAEQLCGSLSGAVMQPPLPVERLAHDLIQIVVLRRPSELGADAVVGGDDCRRGGGPICARENRRRRPF